MSKLIHAALTLSSAAVAVAGAFQAAPIAIHLFGFATGWVITGGVAVGVFAGWHTGFNSTSTKARIIGISTAAIFSAASVLAIHSGVVLEQAEKTRLENEKYQARLDAEKARVDTINAETLKAWQERESSRLDLLNQVTGELRATSKSKNPAEYAALMQQMTTLQVVEKQPEKEKAEITTVQQPAVITTETDKTELGVIQWVQSFAYEVVAPVLLLLASFYRTARQTESETSGYTGNDVCNPTENVCNPIKNDKQAEIDPLKAILGRLIASCPSNGVTAASVSKYCGCGIRPARNARDKAVKLGYLVKVGEGKSSRFVYTEEVETSGLSKSDNVVSIANSKRK